MSAPVDEERSGPQVFCELYVTDVAQSLSIFRDALGLTVVRDEGDFALLTLGPTPLFWGRWRGL